MAAAGEYRAKANDLSARARTERSPALRAQYENLALSYLRLAEQAQKNANTDLVYETPAVQQQQQAQPTKKEQ
jgi:hypothetical protein